MTFTCNQKNHFGTAPIKNWMDDGGWKDHYPGFKELTIVEQAEIERAVLQSSCGLMMRVWEEVFLLFIDYIKKSKSSPLKKFRSIFARKEFQPEVPNLSHSHMIIEVDYDAMTAKERAFVDDLIRNGMFEVVRTNEISDFIKQGLFTSPDDIHKVFENALKFLRHLCNDRCLAKKADGSMRCRKLDNHLMSKDNTRHTYMALPNKYTVPCMRILEKIGLTTKLEIDENGRVLEFESDLDYFHPMKHIPPTNPN